MASSAMSGSLHVERMSVQVRCGWKGNETVDGGFPTDRPEVNQRLPLLRYNDELLKEHPCGRTG